MNKLEFTDLSQVNLMNGCGESRAEKTIGSIFFSSVILNERKKKKGCKESFASF